MYSKLLYKGYKYSNLATMQQLFKMQVVYKGLLILNPKLPLEEFNVTILRYQEMVLHYSSSVIMKTLWSWYFTLSLKEYQSSNLGYIAYTGASYNEKHLPMKVQDNHRRSLFLNTKLSWDLPSQEPWDIQSNLPWDLPSKATIISTI